VVIARTSHYSGSEQAANLQKHRPTPDRPKMPENGYYFVNLAVPGSHRTEIVEAQATLVLS